MEQRVGNNQSRWPRFRGAGLPQRLHRLLVDHYGEDVIPLYSHLMGVIEAFAGEPSSLRAVVDTALMLDHVKNAALRLEAAEVRVSIIVPVFNNLVYTLTSIAAVLEHGTRVPFEIIVGDDQSSDETFAVLTSLGGCVRVVRHATNLGFLHNCNRTAELARGEIIVMLNNDTLVLPEWLDAMVATFEAYPAAGFVGSKLINGDGTLQEAGGIVWRDASGWNFGRNTDPSRPAYNYVKDVDYVSGASIAVPRAVWNRLGGFDPIYAPGYYEDSDLAFRVRAAGYRTLYQPSSSLIHHEGRSHGRDINVGVKSAQRINRQTFRTRWRTTLEADHFARGEEVFVARDRSRSKTHILFVSQALPQWEGDAGSQTLFHYLTFFRDYGFQVTMWPDRVVEDRASLRRLQDLGIEVLAHADADRLPAWLARKQSWIDYAFINHFEKAQAYLDALSAAKIKVIYYAHDGLRRGTSDDQDLTDGVLDERAAVDLRTLASVPSQSHVILTSSIREADEVRGLGAERKHLALVPKHVLSDAVLDAAGAKLESLDRADPCALMFAGGSDRSHSVDAISWFVREVLPLVRQLKPTVHLRVAGCLAPQAVADLVSDHVSIMGRVNEDELRELYAGSAVAVMPLRHGREVKGKLIEAFVNATPVVSTSFGVQGIDDPRSMAFVADDPSDFAGEILRAMADREEAWKRARHALAFVRRHYTEASALEALAPHVPELRRKPAPSGAVLHCS